MEQYKQFFRCYPVSELDVSDEKKREANFGGKIYMPASALGRLMMIRIRYPMLFELKVGRSATSVRSTYAGVHEFIAPEGRVYLPDWMISTLKIKQGALIEIRSVSLALGNFVKIEPQSTDFLEISDPKAVLENSLRKFSTLHVDDIFQIQYNQKIYAIKVLEVKPESDRKAICCVETDLVVDFAPPVGYVEPSEEIKEVKPTAVKPTTTASKAYVEQAHKQDTGFKLNGREVKVEVLPVDASIYEQRDAPELILPQGQLFFGFPVVPVTTDTEEKPKLAEGQTLRGSRT